MYRAFNSRQELIPDLFLLFLVNSAVLKEDKKTLRTKHYLLVLRKTETEILRKTETEIA